MTLEQRLERLERQNRRMKRIGGLVLAVAAAVLLSGQARGKDLQHLKARSLTLIDANGKIRVVLADHGVRVLDRNQKNRATLGTLGDGSSRLRLYDHNGKNRVGLGAFADGGSPSLFLRDKDGKLRAALRTLANGSHLLLYDENHKNRAALFTLGNGLTRLALYDKNGKTRAALAALADGSPRLFLSDRDGHVRAELGGTITVDKRTGAEIKTAESTLTLFDAKGTMIWQAPR